MLRIWSCKFGLIKMMKNKILFWITQFLSLALSISFIAFTVNDFLNVERSYFWIICYSCPFSLAILLALLSFRFNSEISPKLKYLPLAINILTVIVGIGLFQFNHVNPDFGFIQHYKDYSKAASLIENGKLSINNEGFATLPDNLSHTSLTGHVLVTKDKGVTTIYFLDDAETFDGYSWGYLYRSDGSEPPQAKIQDRKNCSQWRTIIPPMTKWYYCEVHPTWFFPGL
jgi:hypothetical protein